MGNKIRGKQDGTGPFGGKGKKTGRKQGNC
jgi:hypothetical protein